ncbi:DUF4885 family protein [Arcobacter porcinus]|uniref:DUF4885 domain-containing protein n=1 Tax=Arcobacter porcinus TaxID=1935204 RepID=A0ABX2YI25_9BACT|nr:DUF4885 family protein [Arcobacter porcinus]OCL88231.1 hypothetical protein AAX30_00841 [Arcobacter porcinus]OCL92487.1 hypothetical protein AAX28_00019 [Arcobacter porcinus]
MIINTSTSSFSSKSGIKVTQHNNSSYNSNNKNEVNLNISSNTLNSLNKLSSLDEQTFLKANTNGYVNLESKIARERLEDIYSKATKENLKFKDPESHINNKYFSPTYPHYIEGLSKTEREVAYKHEIDYLKNGKLNNINYIDPNIKDLPAVNGCIEELEEKSFKRDRINNQFQELLNRYDIDIPKDTNINFTIDPYDFKVNVSGIDDNNLKTLLEDALNTADNSKELFKHIYKSSSYNNSQISLEKNNKNLIFHEIKDKTGYDLRDLENKDGKFFTQDGVDIIELYKEGVIKSNDIPEQYKGLMFEHNVKVLNDLALKGFDNVPDMNLSIDYKNGSFYDIGQSENFGTGKRDWLDNLKASKEQTLDVAFKEYRKDYSSNKSNQTIIKDSIYKEEYGLNLFKSRNLDLIDKYKDNPELLKLLLIQKYLFGKNDDSLDKKFFELLDNWEDLKSNNS